MVEEDPLAHAKRDWQLENRVVAALSDREMPSLRQLQVEACDGTVTLRGSVRSCYEKQLSRHCVRQLSGVSILIDEIEVKPAAAVEDPQRRLNRAAIGGAAMVLVLSIAAPAAATSRDTDPSRLPVVPVQGKVSFNGQPVPGASIVFHPKGAPEAPHPRATADKLGNFKLTTYEPSDGAPLGEYLVTVEWPQLRMEGGDAHYVNALPSEYLSVNSTKLQATVWEGHENRVSLNLRGAAPAGATR